MNRTGGGTKAVFSLGRIKMSQIERNVGEAGITTLKMRKHNPEQKQGYPSIIHLIVLSGNCRENCGT